MIIPSENSENGDFTVAEGLILLTDRFVEEKIMERCTVCHKSFIAFLTSV